MARLIRTTIRPGEEILVEDAEYAQLLRQGLVYGEALPAPPDPDDVEVAGFLDNETSQTYARLLAQLAAAVNAGTGVLPDALRAAFGSRPALPGGYEDATSRTRRAAVAVGGTAGGKGTNNGVNQATFRYPFRLATGTKRWRLCVRNYDSRSDITYTGAINFNGAWVGQHALSNGAHTGAFTAAPVQALTSFSTAADGSVFRSAWVTDAAAQFSPYVEHLLSVAWTCTAGQTNIRTTGNAWYSGTNATLGGQQAATGLAFINLGILDIWIEVEYAGATPIIALFGDSLTSGENAARPWFDSYGNRFALAHGIIPVHYSYSGSTLEEWTTTTAFKWTKYQTGATKPDAAVLGLHNNNIFNGETSVAVQAKLTTFMQNVRTVLGINTLYVTTVLPRNDATAKETERQTYNTWIRGCPNGAAGVIDFDAVVRDPSNAANILPAFNSGDNVHLNAAGYAIEASRAMGAPLVRVA